MSRSVTLKGNPVDLEGPEISVGDTAPDATLKKDLGTECKLSELSGVRILSVVPSLDTPVCEVQTKRFNEEAAELEAQVITISLDLPFAQGRFCKANEINNHITVSDYQNREFANAYGILIKELMLLARAVFVIDTDGTLVYQEIVPEVTDYPDYDKALEATKSAGA